MTLLNSATLSANGEQITAAPQQPGLYDIETQLEGQRPARFTLSLPAAIATDDARPLVVVLHYAGQPTRFYGRPLIEGLFETAWRDLGAIFVAPESLGGQWTSSTNEAFVMQLIESIKNTYAVDDSQIVVAGYSMGAIGSWHFIRNYPEQFAAAVPVAGYPSGELDCPVPIFTLATEADEIFDFKPLQAQVAALGTSPCNIELRVVPARGHYDVGGFVEGLQLVLPWLREIFDSKASKGAKQ